MDKFLADAALKWKVEVNRNTFDKSKKHFASYNLGAIYPMFVQHCQANETIKIRPSMSFDLEPMTHELYNDLKCNTAWFKVYTRSLWGSWRKFTRQDPTKTSSIVHPYISRADNWCTVGSLANHMGIPVAKYGVADGNTSASFASNDEGFSDENQAWAWRPTLDIFQPFVNRDLSNLSVAQGGVPCFMPLSIPASLVDNRLYPLYDRTAHSSFTDWLHNPSSSRTSGIVIGSGLNTLVADDFKLYLPHIGNLSSLSLNVSLWSGSSLSSSRLVYSEDFNNVSSSSNGTWTSTLTNSTSVYPHQGTISYPTTLNTEELCFTFTSDFTHLIQQEQTTNAFVTLCICPSRIAVTSTPLTSSFAVPNYFSGSFYLDDTDENNPKFQIVSGFYGYPRYSSVSEVNEVFDSPFVGTSPTLPINALPFRAYENIYNSHFRDLIHDPLRDDHGDIMVDQYVDNMGDGADSSTSVELRYCRFEPDLFNTCLPTPTMGDGVNRPLVGITAGADPTSATLNYNINGEAISYDVKIHGSDSTITEVNAAGHSEDANNLTYLTLKDAINYGISLQDMQNVQALTKWYEASYRGKGRFSYNEFIAAHFGKTPSLQENLAAEYLGGNTTYVNSMKVVNQTSSSDSKPLGSTGGMANFNSKDDSISCFCDEDCYIMGVVWFTCDNVNSQSIDPMFYLSQPSDYATPEFADLGVMPIQNKVVAPLQCPTADLAKVFGYQRMYGDKLFSFDTVAGDFLTMKSDYLMQRRFDDMPTLTADLAKMHPEDFTNVFVYDTSYDKIYGRWYFDVTLSTWLQQTPNAQII